MGAERRNSTPHFTYPSENIKNMITSPSKDRTHNYLAYSHAVPIRHDDLERNRKEMYNLIDLNALGHVIEKV